MSLFLSAITTQNILIREPSATTFSIGTSTDLLSPGGEFALEDIRSSSDLQTKINLGDVILTTGNNEVIVNLSTVGLNCFNTYDGIIARDVSVLGNVGITGTLSGDSLYSGSTELTEIINAQVELGISGLTSSYFDSYDVSGGTISNTTAWTATVPLNSQRQIGNDFSHSTTVNNDEVTINTATKYLVIGRVSSESVSSTSRTQAECRLEIDTGSGFVEVPGTIGEMYLRQSNYGASGSFQAVLDLEVGDKLRITFSRRAGGAQVKLEAGGSSLTIAKVVGGQKGDKGTPGDLYLNNFTDFYVSGTTFSNVFSGNTQEAIYYGDGSNLNGISFYGLTDTSIISPENGSIPMYNSGTTKWENNNPTSHVKSTVISTWTLLSGTTYYYDFSHNLGTLDLLWNLRDMSSGSYILPTDIVPQNTNVLRILIGDNISIINLTVSDAIYGITNTPKRNVINKQINYSAVTNDIVWANPTGGTLTIFLPEVSTSSNFPVSINHIGTVGTVVINGNGANVNGQTGFTLYNSESIEFYSNGIEWRQHN